MKKILIITILIALSLSFVSCAKKTANKTDGEKKKEATNLVKNDGPLWIFIYYNAQNNRIFLQNVVSGKQEEYEYNAGTYIYDRYGTSTIIDKINSGELVNIASFGEENKQL